MLTVHNIHKSYRVDQPVLRGVDLVVEPGEIVCLLGPSGCGKTTLLRIVAGLEQPDRGSVHFAGDDLLPIPVHARNFGFMFQEFALFPHRTVAENIAFGLRMAGQSTAQINTRVAEMLDLVDLPGYGDRSIFELSGGERQRVALARSLAPHPRLLLLDEPLGSLDRALREELMGELRKILKKIGQTVLFVTHDQQEALAVADRIAVMNAGRIEQIATPPQLHQRPATAFVARFLGFHNLLPAQPLPGDPSRVRTVIGDFVLSEPPAAPAAATLLIRPDAAQIATADPARSLNVVRGEVIATSFRGSHTLIDLAARLPTGAPAPIPPLRFAIANTSSARLNVGDVIELAIDPAGLQLIGE